MGNYITIFKGRPEYGFGVTLESQLKTFREVSVKECPQLRIHSAASGTWTGRVPQGAKK